jgi:hypothetical protein
MKLSPFDQALLSIAAFAAILIIVALVGLPR